MQVFRWTAVVTRAEAFSSMGHSLLQSVRSSVLQKDLGDDPLLEFTVGNQSKLHTSVLFLFILSSVPASFLFSHQMSPNPFHSFVHLHTCLLSPNHAALTPTAGSPIPHDLIRSLINPKLTTEHDWNNYWAVVYLCISITFNYRFIF